MALLYAVLAVVGTPLAFMELHTVCTTGSCVDSFRLTPRSVEVLQHAGLSPSSYASTIIVFVWVTALVHWALAAILLWRRPGHPVALILAITFIVAPTRISVLALWHAHPALALPARALLFVSQASLVPLYSLFPNGRWVPRWSRWVALTVVGYKFLFLFFVFPVPDTSPWAQVSMVLAPLSFSYVVCAQVYRYWRVSDRAERQQTKWGVIGIAVAMAGALLWTAPGLFLNEARAAAVQSLAPFWTLPLGIFTNVCFVIAILRGRLFDIDLVLNRALVYGLLTAGVVGLYVGIVGAVGRLLHSPDTLLGSLLATGLIAAVFQPARAFLQRLVNRLLYGARDEPFAVVTRLGHRLEASLAPEAVLPTIVQAVAVELKLPYVAIALQQPDASAAIHAAHGAPAGHTIALPLLHRGEPIGHLVVAPRPGEATLGAPDRRLLEDLAQRAGAAAHAVRLTDALQRSRAQLVAAREEERRRLRRDLHDGLGPALATITLQADTARGLVRADPGEAEALLGDLTAQAQATMGEVRRLIHALRPPVLDDLGLADALRALAASFGSAGPAVAVEAPAALPPLPAAVEVAAYRIAQEALTNAVKHAGARRCVVSLRCDGALHLSICDDGRGLAPGRAAGVGLASMRERAEELGGWCRVVPAEHGGTVVCADLPLGRHDGPAPPADR